MKNSKLFQYVVIGIFIFFIVIGAILFATYRSSDQANAEISVTIWGTMSADSFSSFTSRYFSESGLKYNVKYVAVDPAVFDQTLVEALASGAGPDAIILPDNLIVRYADKVYTIPYTVLPELTFKNAYIQEGELYLNDNGVMALPFYVDPLVMYWNRDLFNNAGLTKPPVSWTELPAMTSSLVKKDSAKNITTSAFALGEYRNVKNAKEILSTLFIQAGSSIVKAAADGTLSSSLMDGAIGSNSATPAEQALSFYTSFSNPTRSEYTWNRSLTDSQSAFANGDLAVYFGFASEYARIKEKNPNLNFDVAVLPQAAKAKTYSTFGHIWGLAIMKQAANPASTYTVISALTSAAAYPYWQERVNLPSARRDILGQAETNAVKSIFNKSAVLSKGWLDPNAKETSTIFQNMVEYYTTGRASLDEAVSDASGALGNLLNK